MRTHTKLRIVQFLSAVCSFGPAIVCVIAAIVGHTAVVNKITLTFAAILALVFLFLCLLRKVKISGFIWFMLVGLAVSLSDMRIPIIAIGCGILLDDWVFDPLKAKVKMKAEAEKAVHEVINDEQ